jgi:murein DD-endopeptidase MepM/ murein hydrolase activator NlpD
VRTTTRRRTALAGAVLATTLCGGPIADRAAADDTPTSPATDTDAVSQRAPAVLAVERSAERLPEPSSIQAREEAAAPAWPVAGELTSEFGQRNGRLHRGIDVAAPIGTPIHAVQDGVVTFAGVQSGYGNTVEIDHGDGHESLSAHQSELLVEQGDRVRRGQRIGRVGSTGSSTGPHLHFEYTVTDQVLDPLELLPAA